MKRDWPIALALALVTVLWMTAVEGRQGIGRDEAQYLRASERYWGWFENAWQNLRAGRLGASFTRAGIDAYWGDNPEHPPLMKLLYGVSWRAFHRCECPREAGYHPIPIIGKHVTLPLFQRESSAFRFPATLFAGLLAALVFLFARGLVGRLPAAAAAALTIAQPHYFFHAQIAAFDAPITTMAFAVAFAYWKSLRSARWGVLTGVIYGLALATKHNAWLIPFFLLAHYLWIRRGDLRARRVPRLPLAFVSMAILGPLVLLALWPRLWPEPIERVGWYLMRHLDHEHYNFEYLRNWNLPPKDLDLVLLRTTFPFLSTLFTVPVTTLALAAAGAVALVRRRRDEDEPALTPEAPAAERPSWLRPGADVSRAPGAFLALQTLGPILVLAVPSAPIFGGIKHFMPAMPFLAILAAVGLRWAGGNAALALTAARARRFAPAALAAVACLPALVETRRSHPDGLSHYNLLAGGFAGGASIGLNRQFWGYSVLPVLPWIAANRPSRGNVYWHDVMPDAVVFYQREGRLPPTVGNTGDGEPAIAASDMAMVIHEKHFTLYEGLIWQHYGITQPAQVRTREGVPLVTIFRRPGAP